MLEEGSKVSRNGERFTHNFCISKLSAFVENSARDHGQKLPETLIVMQILMQSYEFYFCYLFLAFFLMARATREICCCCCK